MRKWERKARGIAINGFGIWEAMDAPINACPVDVITRFFQAVSGSITVFVN